MYGDSSYLLNQFVFFSAKIEYRAKTEALRLREMEQKDLERKYGKKKAKEVAQQNFNVRKHRIFISSRRNKPIHF